MKPTKDPRREKAESLYALGMSFKEIAARVGVSDTTIRRWLNPEKQRYDRAYVRKKRTDYHREYQRKRRARMKNSV